MSISSKGHWHKGKWARTGLIDSFKLFSLLFTFCEKLSEYYSKLNSSNDFDILGNSNIFAICNFSQIKRIICNCKINPLLLFYELEGTTEFSCPHMHTLRYTFITLATYSYYLSVKCVSSTYFMVYVYVKNVIFFHLAQNI